MKCGVERIDQNGINMFIIEFKCGIGLVCGFINGELLKDNSKNINNHLRSCKGVE